MQGLTRTLLSLRLFFGVTFSLLLALLTVGCGSKVIPIWTGKFYAVDKVSHEFVRAQTSERLPIGRAPGDWVAIEADDFELFLQVYVVGCEAY